MNVAEDRCFGGIVFDGLGRVLLRRPANNYGGYAWTFAKGGREPHETAEQAALREVEEETGYRARIRGRIPGEFESDTCITEYFLMTAIAQVRQFDHETAEVRWATIEVAKSLIEQSTTPRGRRRDLLALEAAVVMHSTLGQF